MDYILFIFKSIDVLCMSIIVVDENKGAAPRDPLHVPVGPITRARAK